MKIIKTLKLRNVRFLAETDDFNDCAVHAKQIVYTVYILLCFVVAR